MISTRVLLRKNKKGCPDLSLICSTFSSSELPLFPTLSTAPVSHWETMVPLASTKSLPPLISSYRFLRLVCLLPLTRQLKLALMFRPVFALTSKNPKFLLFAYSMAVLYGTSLFGKSHLFPMSIIITLLSTLLYICSNHDSIFSNVSFLVQS